MTSFGSIVTFPLLLPIVVCAAFVGISPALLIVVALLAAAIASGLLSSSRFVGSSSFQLLLFCLFLSMLFSSPELLGGFKELVFGGRVEANAAQILVVIVVQLAGILSALLALVVVSEVFLAMASSNGNTTLRSAFHFFGVLLVVVFFFASFDESFIRPVLERLGA